MNNVFAKDASKRLGGWVVKFKGMKVEFKAFEEMGKRVKKITVNGEKLDRKKMYVVSACEREGDPGDMLCRITNVKDGTNTPFTLHQVLKEYLATNSPVTPKPEGNAIILDAPVNFANAGIRGGLQICIRLYKPNSIIVIIVTLTTSFIIHFCIIKYKTHDRIIKTTLVVVCSRSHYWANCTGITNPGQ